MAILLNLEAENARLLAEVAALKAKVATKTTVSYKVSEKGAVSIYGLGRWPVTLYKSQFQALAKAVPAIEAWIATNPKNVNGEGLAVKE